MPNFTWVFLLAVVAAILSVSYMAQSPRLTMITDSLGDGVVKVQGDSIAFSYCAELPTPCHGIEYAAALSGNEVLAKAILTKQQGVCTQVVTEKCKAARFGPLAPGNYTFKIDGLVSDTKPIQIS